VETAAIKKRAANKIPSESLHFIFVLMMEATGDSVRGGREAESRSSNNLCGEIWIVNYFPARLTAGLEYPDQGVAGVLGMCDDNFRMTNSCRIFAAAVAPMPIAAFSNVNPAPRSLEG
jgi:hypothetical protein